MASQRAIQYNVYQNETSSTNRLAQSLINIRSKNLNSNVESYLEGSGHKLEHVKTINGIDFINDSCSCTSNAVWYALDSMNKRTTWIMTIDDIESLTTDLVDIIDEKVDTIIVQGVYNEEVINFFAGLDKDVKFAMNMEEAVRVAFYATTPGKVILFSPGSQCSGEFKNYAERGNKFKEAIAQL